MRVRESIHDQVNSNEGQRVDLSMIRLIVMRVRGSFHDQANSNEGQRVHS